MYNKDYSYAAANYCMAYCLIFREYYTKSMKTSTKTNTRFTPHYEGAKDRMPANAVTNSTISKALKAVRGIIEKNRELEIKREQQLHPSGR